MYRHYPERTKVSFSNSHDNTIDVCLVADQDTETPTCVESFLLNNGWTKVGQHPDTMEDLWQSKEGHAEYGYYKWEQAVAMQMFLFMNIGPNP